MATGKVGLHHFNDLSSRRNPQNYVVRNSVAACSVQYVSVLLEAETRVVMVRMGDETGKGREAAASPFPGVTPAELGVGEGGALLFGFGG